MNIITLKPKTHATLKEAVVHNLKKTVKVAAFVIVAFILSHWLTAGNSDVRFIDQTQDQGTIGALEEPAEGTPQYVLNQHRSECWVGSESPKAELPGAAIVQFNDGRTIYTKKHSLVDAAFNEALAKVGFGTIESDKLDVVALCE